LSDDTPTYGEGPLSPHAKALMKAMGGDPRFMSLTPGQVARWALDRPESPLNLLPDTELAGKAAALSEEFWELTEQELKERCSPGHPSRVDLRVKLRFWEEYEQAAAKLQPMDLAQAIEGTGGLSWSVFRGALLEDPFLLAWFMLPPPGYRMQLQEAESLGLSRLMEILELPIVDPRTKKVRADIGKLIIEAWKLVDLRRHGAVTQRVVSLSASAGSVPDGATQMDMQKVEERLNELRSQVEGRGPVSRDEGHRPPDRVEPKTVLADILNPKKPT
jgi:hypothetical protein